jgi:hypothetical protein
MYQQGAPQKNTRFEATVLPDGRWLLYDRAANTAVSLNASTGIFWELCDGHTSLDQIVAQLHELYPDTDVTALESETRVALATLVEQGLVVNGG